ncbi:hypothetical protein R6Q59_019234 [Mikania micrantha]
MKKFDDLVSEIERNFNEAFINYPDDDGIKDAMVSWRSRLLKFGKQMGDDHATHSDKDQTLDSNTKDPFDSTQYNISCSMMDELEKSVLSKYDGTNEKGKTICDIGASNDVPSFDLMLSQMTPVNPAPVDPGVDLHVSVLDCWADVLNSEDQYRNNSDPKRLFTPCLMLVDSHYKDDVEEVDRITSFTKNMEICLKSAELDSLIGVDLLFIPMLHACHYYVLCFNMKKAQVFVIDNLGTDMDFDIKYAKRPQIMQSTLCSYLVMTSHPNAFTLKTSESDEQQRQLNDPRIKYLAKILLSDINIHKGEVVSEVRAYVNLLNDVKEKMREGVFERIKHRVRSAF